MNSDTEIKVWDPLVRVFHWCLVAAFFTAYFTEDDLQSVHVWAGYSLCVLIALRLIWGIVGPRPARFSDFVYGPATVLRYSKAVLHGNAKRYLGHNPAGGAMIIALLLFVLTTTVSGMMLYGADAWLGPLAGLMKDSSESTIEVLEELHELTANATIVLIVVHVFGVIWESVLHQENLVKAMITGRKRAETTNPTLN